MKYHNTKVNLDGYLFDSKMERQYYLYLKEQKEKGEIQDYTVKPPPYVLLCKHVKNKHIVRPITYEADFTYIDNDGVNHVVDVKGVLTEVFKLKKKLLEYFYPEVTLELVKEVPGNETITKQSSRNRKRVRPFNYIRATKAGK
jgi:hypothetical protein